LLIDSGLITAFATLQRSKVFERLYFCVSLDGNTGTHRSGECDKVLSERLREQKKDRHYFSVLVFGRMPDVIARSFGGGSRGLHLRLSHFINALRQSELILGFS